MTANVESRVSTNLCSGRLHVYEKCVPASNEVVTLKHLGEHAGSDDEQDQCQT